jgi:hypothetical protein
MPVILLLVPDGDHDASRFTALHDSDYLIGLGLPEVWIEGFVAAIFGRVEDRSAPLLRSVHYPVLELAGDVAQHIPRLTGYC